MYAVFRKDAFPLRVLAGYSRSTRVLSICVVVALFAGLLLTPVQAQSPRNAIDPIDLETFLDVAVPAHLEEYGIPGATLAVVGDDQLLLAKGYGYADLEQGIPVDGERTLFRTGSVGKLITWTAVMQLVEEGLLDLHTDVNEYLDFTIPATFPEPITLAHLLTHTAGFEDVSDLLFVLSPDELLPLDQYLKQYQPMRAFPPGKVNAYSNYGAALAGYIVERVSGEPFDAYVENHIFAPLDMERSTVRQPVPEALAGDLAAGYNASGEGYLRGEFIYVVPYPAGSMSAPAADMARFVLAHLQGHRGEDTAILQGATAQEMHQRLFTPDPRIDGMAYGFMEQRVNGRDVLYHRGSILQFNTGLYLLPEENVGLYVAYNSVTGVEGTASLWQEFMDHYYPAPPDALPEPSPDATTRIAAYAGEYHLARADFRGPGKMFRLLEGAQVTASPEGNLLLTVEGRAEPYSEVEPGLFRHQERDEWLAFHPDDDGRLWLSLDGRPAFVNFTGTSAFKVPWYATLSFSALLILLTLLLVLLSGLGWLIGWLRRRRSGEKRPPAASLARWSALAFGGFLLLFLVMFAGILTDTNPVYGAPSIVFGTPPLANVMLALPWLALAAAVGLVVGTAMVWRGAGGESRSPRGVWTGLHYTLLAVLALAVIWWFWYWGLFSPFA